MSTHYDDQVYYSTGQIRALMPFVIEWVTNDSYTLPDDMDVFMVMDVSLGLLRLEPYHQALVFAYYSSNWSQENRASYIGAMLNEDEDLVRKRLSRAVRKIQEYLGGERPTRRVTDGTRAGRGPEDDL